MTRSHRRSIFALLACLSSSLSLPCCTPDDYALGNVLAEGTKMGTWSRGPSGKDGPCRSGCYDKFVGADLYLNGVTMRVVKDPVRGPRIVFIEPTSKLRVDVGEESCSSLDLKVDQSCVDSPVPQFDSVGAVTFACNLPTGGKVSGSTKFRCSLHY